MQCPAAVWREVSALEETEAEEHFLDAEDADLFASLRKSASDPGP
jgi:hypothetical protein